MTKVVVAVPVTIWVSVTVCVVELQPTAVTTKGVVALSVAVPSAVTAWLAWPVEYAVSVPVMVPVELVLCVPITVDVVLYD
jgi:hypothetical protein